MKEKISFIIFCCIFSFLPTIILPQLFADISDITKAKVVPQDKARKDLDTAKEVKSAISVDPKLSTYAKSVQAKADNGIVTLTGMVPTIEVRAQIETKALSVSSVNSVINNIEVQSSK